METLRDYTEHREFYIDCIQTVIDMFSRFLGEDISEGIARKAPLQITPRGHVNAYYGTGRKALLILKENYEDYMGESVADSKMKSALSDVDKSKREILPEDIRPEDTVQGESFISRVLQLV